jgi:L-2,4-diaminobutyric acid acetyltransferase
MSENAKLDFKIRNVKLEDVKEVYKLLVANRPYVGLNSRYTYFLLAKDFSNTCVVAEHEGKIIAFSSGYIPPSRKDTFFNWETVVHQNYRGHSLQKRLLLHQIKTVNAKYFEGTVNPSNDVSKRNFCKLAEMLSTKCQKTVLFTEEDFENDGHEAEVLYRIGPISQNELKQLT